MKIVQVLPVKNRDHFLETYFSDEKQGGLFIEGAQELQIGETIPLKVKFLEENKQFRAQAVIHWKRFHNPNKKLPAGIGIRLLPEQDAGSKLILDFALGKEVSMIHRKDSRFPAGLDVKTADKSKGQLFDISVSGAFITTDAPFTVGEKSVVILRPPGHFRSLRFQAKVVWVKKSEPKGIGICFETSHKKEKQQLNNLVQKLKQKYLKEIKVRIPQKNNKL